MYVYTYIYIYILTHTRYWLSCFEARNGTRHADVSRGAKVPLKFLDQIRQEPNIGFSVLMTGLGCCMHAHTLKNNLMANPCFSPLSEHTSFLLEEFLASSLH